MNTRLLHVVGGGVWQVPTIRLAQSMGYCVLVTDKYADRPGFDIADHHEQVDILDLEGTLEVARRYRVNGILCDTTDIGVPCAASVAEHLGLPGPGYECALNFCHKGRMRECLVRAGMATPSFRAVASLGGAIEAARDIGYPIVIKPADNQSGRGVSRVLDEADLPAAFEAAWTFSRTDTVVVESFLVGVELIVDSFSINGGTHVLGIARKTQYPQNPTISRSIDYPAELSREQIAAVADINARTISALGLRDGITHGEFMLTGNAIYPLDIAARGGGVMIYTHVLPYLAGFDVNGAMITYAMGGAVQIPEPPVGRAASVSFFTFPAGELREIIGTQAAASVPGVAAVHFNLQVGDVIGDFGKKDDRPGYLIAVGETLDQVRSAVDSARSLLKVRVAGADALLSAS